MLTFCSHNKYSMIDVFRVGPSLSGQFIHRFIGEKIPYFKKHLSTSGVDKSQIQVLELPDCDPKAFCIVIEYLSTSVLSATIPTRGEWLSSNTIPISTQVPLQLLRMIQVYLLAKKLELEELANRAIDHIRHAYREYSVECRELLEIEQHCQKDKYDALREFMVLKLAYDIKQHGWAKYMEEHWGIKEEWFAKHRDAAEELGRTATDMGDAGDPAHDEHPCKWHIHETTVACKPIKPRQGAGKEHTANSSTYDRRSADKVLAVPLVHLYDAVESIMTDQDMFNESSHVYKPKRKANTVEDKTTKSTTDSQVKKKSKKSIVPA